MKENCWFVAIMLVVIAILVSVVLYTTDYMTTEVERYSIGMEITHAEEST